MYKGESPYSIQTPDTREEIVRMIQEVKFDFSGISPTISQLLKTLLNKNSEGRMSAKNTR
jgi:hypothetical protein